MQCLQSACDGQLDRSVAARPAASPRHLHGTRTVQLHDYSAKLPVEVLARILDWMSFLDLVRAGHVSKRWRDISRHHPNFWQTIKLSSTESASIDRYNAQLRVSARYSIKVHLNIVGTSEPETARTVLAALARNIHRVEKLHIQADPDRAVDVFGALQSPAPRLRQFVLSFNVAPMHAPAFPCNIFDGDAPLLRAVMLNDICIPEDPVPAFALVETAWHAESMFSTDQCGEWIYVQRWLQIFPAASSLGFHGGERRMDPRTDLDVVHQRMLGVKTLMLAFNGSFGCTSNFLRSLPGAALVPELHTYRPDSATVSEMLAHLDGPLQIDLAPDTEEQWGFTTTLTDLKTARKRVLIDGTANYIEDYPAPFFRSPKAWEPQISEVVIAQSMWTMMTKHLPTFSVATRVTLRLDLDTSPISALTGVPPLDCPLLKQLILETVFEQSFVKAQDLSSLIRDCFKGAPTGVGLELKGPIIIVDEMGDLAQRFCSIARTAE